MKALRVSWDKDYGIDRRTGWTISYDGSVLVQLEPWLIVAAYKAWREWRFILSSRRADGL